MFSTWNAVASSGRDAMTIPRSSSRIRCTQSTVCCASPAGSTVNTWSYLFLKYRASFARRPASASATGDDSRPAVETVWKSTVYDMSVGPPVAPALDVVARSVAETGRADHEDLETIGPGLVASPRAGRDAHRVPLPELDDLVVELHPAASAHHHVDLLLLLVSVAVRKAIPGRDALIRQAGLLELERQSEEHTSELQ